VVLGISVGSTAACGSTPSQTPSAEAARNTGHPATTAGRGSTAASAPKTRPTSRATASVKPSAKPGAASGAGSVTASGAKGGTAAAMLATLPVKGRAPMTGYSRAQYGPAWADVDHNGCDTRNDILARDLTRIVDKAGTHGCIVASGTLADPYTATSIAFVRGVKTSTTVQIDHLVALGDAWQTGAQKLSAGTREALANDPLELLAVSGAPNEQKGDGDAATWLPPNKAFRCQYVARQVAVKHKYGMWVTPAEHDAIARVLATCPSQKVPSGATAPIVVVSGKEATSGLAPAKAAAPRGAVAPKGTGHPATTAPVSKTDCPTWAPIKGNASSHIFHVPGGEYYARTDPEVCFATTAAAVADGYRASKR
jgi:hypothetical protein